MTAERRDVRSRGRRITDPDWLAHYSRPLALLVVLQFVVLAALAIGIAVTSSTAQNALAVNERREAETIRLRDDVRRLTVQNEELLSQVDALRGQVETLGGTPVTVTVEDRRSPTPTTQPTTTTTARPAPPTTTTTACRLPSPVGCLRSSGRAR